MKKQIIAEIRAWEATSGSNFLVYGLTFEDYVKKQCDEYKAEKDNKKLMRVSNYDIVMNCGNNFVK